MVIWLFVSGIIGARVLYMIQYANHFPDQSIAGLLGAFFKIWEGGIVFYGSALGGTLGYGLFYWFVLRRLNVSGWQLADAVAPLLALGLAIGRIGCYLNGCCWGQVACEECRAVPLGASHFPLLPAHSRPMLVRDEQLQTTTGFAIAPRRRAAFDDSRAEVVAVEAGSPAEKAGVKVGDRVAKVNGGPNYIIVDISGTRVGPDGPEDAAKVAERLKALGGKDPDHPAGKPRVVFDEYGTYALARRAVPDGGGIDYAVTDRLEELARDWPRGKEKLALEVERSTERVELPTFTPVTVGLYPTQLYETVSMVLLILFLLAYYPYRRHDGQLMVLLMIGYAIHRFVNESLRIEPSYAGGLTLSQWGSVIIFVLAIAIEIYLWRTMPSRWKGEGPQPAPAPAPAPAAPPATPSQTQPN
jgi:prolipoprotein diacylglyceryltransferase